MVKTRRTGFTVLELLVVMGIVGLLVALILPAVQRSRETARQAQCRNHLHQLGIAAAISIDADGRFPVENGKPVSMQHIENSLDLWVCPSDGYGIGNYLWNDGTEKRIPFGNGMYVRQENPLRAEGARPSDILDGMSQTVAMSERLVMNLNDGRLSESELKREPLRYLWYLPRWYASSEKMCAACLSEATTPAPFKFHTGLFGPIGYDHNLPPNTRGCLNGPVEDAKKSFYIPPFYSSAFTATSRHPDLVHVLLCDGAVRRVNDSVDLEVWHALGTRNGQETNAW